MIKAEKITKYYGANAAVKNLSFEIGDGQVIGLLGLNGAGKTTTLRILSGLLVPTSGSVTIDGVDFTQNPDVAKANIGFLPESVPLYPEMTVESFLRFVARIKGVVAGVDEAVQLALESCDLVERRGDRIDTLSHGFRRRVGIAHAIVHKPSLILLDEPTNGLDPVQIVQMRKLIRALRERHTIIVSSHILGEIHQLCDRIFVLQDGQIVAEGTEGELANNVSRSTTVSLEVRGDVAALSAALKKASQVSRHSVQRDSEGIVEAVVELGSDTREELAQALVEAGLGLRRFDRVSLELESIFLQLTGRKEGTQDAARSAQQSKDGEEGNAHA